MRVIVNHPLAAEGRSTLLEWRANPNKFVRQVFNDPCIPDGWQDEALEAAADPEKTHIAIRANKGPGKTAFLAWLILWFLTCFEDSNITATSITGENLRDNLWKELALWMHRSDILDKLFVWTKERVFAKDPKHEAHWWCSARKWAKDADPQQQANTLAGLHAKYVMAIVDESGGVPSGVVEAAEGILANLEVDGGVAKVVLTGNPTHCCGPLYRAFELEPETWWRLHLTADPLFNAPRGKRPLKYMAKDSITRFTNRVSPKYVRMMVKRYGRNSPVVLVNCFGEFPLGVSDAIVSIEQFKNSFTAYATPHPSSFPRILGADIARQGSNETVICRRLGNAVPSFTSWRGMRTDVTADRIEEIMKVEGFDVVHIDDVGSGGGVTDQLIRRKVPVVPIDVGATTCMVEDEKVKHLNLRSILYHDLQDRFVVESIKINPQVEEDTTLVEEGSTLQIEWTDRNKRKIEAKHRYKKRTGKSPDYLDALMLAFADRVGGPVTFSQTVEAETPAEDLDRLLPMVRRQGQRLLDRRNPHASSYLSARRKRRVG